MTLQGVVEISSASTLTLTAAYSIYVYNGSGTATWTLPAVSGNSGEMLVLYNRGSSTVTVTRAGSDQVDNQGAMVNSVSLTRNSSMQLLNDGTYWLVVSGSAPLPAFDNCALSAAQSSLASGTAFTWTQTVAAGSPYGIVALVAPASTTMTTAATAAVTFGGVTLTQFAPPYYVGNDSGSSRWVWLFGGASIPSGTQTVSATITQSGETFSGYGASLTYSNVTTGSGYYAYGANTFKDTWNSYYVDYSPVTNSPNIVCAVVAAGDDVPLGQFVTRQQISTGTQASWVGDIEVFNTSSVELRIGTNDYGGSEYVIAAVDLH